MPELRKDPISDRWVIIATERAARPTDFKATPQPIKGGFCPFCKGNEDKTPPEITAIRKGGTKRDEPGWSVRVVPNKFPALQIEGSLGKRGDGIYDLMNGIGAHEVIIETPEHEITMTGLPRNHIASILTTYRDRLVDLKRDQRFVYGLIFKNVGSAAGASLEHTHSQLIATPIVPIIIAREMKNCLNFYNYRGRCIFCDMIVQEKSSETRVIADSGSYLAFAPFAPRFPFECWVLPKEHQTHFENLSNEEADELAGLMKLVLSKIESSLNQPPYNFIIHSTPFDQGKAEHYHWHIEIIPRLTKVAGFEWGTGFYINPVAPESAAEYLREVNGQTNEKGTH